MAIVKSLKAMLEQLTSRRLSDRERYKTNIVLANKEGGDVDEARFVADALKVGKSVDDALADVELYSRRLKDAADLKEAERLVAVEEAAARESTEAHHVAEQVEAECAQRIKDARRAASDASDKRSSIARQRSSLLRARERLQQTADPEIHQELASIARRIETNHQRFNDARSALHWAKQEHGKLPPPPDLRMMGLGAVRVIEQPRETVDKSAEIAELEAVIAECEKQAIELQQLREATARKLFLPENFAIAFNESAAV